MSFKMHCPNCSRVLNVTEKAYGKVVRCPGCSRPVAVSYPAQPLVQASHVDGPPMCSAGSAPTNDGHATRDSRMAVPPSIPPLPPTPGLSFECLSDVLDRPAGSSAQGQQAQEWQGEARQSVGQLAEEEAIKGRYPALRILASIHRAIGVMVALGFLAAAGITAGLAIQRNEPSGLVVGLGVLICGGLAWLELWCVAELLSLATDVANDLRISRLLLRGLRYQDQDKSSPQA